MGFGSKKYVIYVLGAGSLWGCMGILVRTLNEGGFNSLEVTAFRSFVTAAVMLGVMAVCKPRELAIRWKDLWCFLGTGLMSVIFFNVCYFSCMNQTSLSVAAILLYTAPSFVMVMSFFLFKEKIGRRKLAALLLAFAGCVLVSGGIGGDGITGTGLLTGLGAGFGYALYSIFSRYALRRGYSSYTITTYTFLFAAFGTLPMMKPAHFLKCCGALSAPRFVFAVCMAVLTTVAAYLLYTAGLQGMENGRASIIASIEPVVASLVGFLLYKEAMTAPGLIGMLLVLLSCVLIG